MNNHEYMKHVYALRMKDKAEKILKIIYENRQFGCVELREFFFCILISYGGLKKKQNKTNPQKFLQKLFIM